MLTRAKAETEKSENLFLYIDLPRFDFPVVFTEPVGLRGSLNIQNNEKKKSLGGPCILGASTWSACDTPFANHTLILVWNKFRLSLVVNCGSRYGSRKSC